MLCHNYINRFIIRYLSGSLRVNCIRCSSTSNSAAYDGDGKTTVRVLNHDESHLNLVNAYSHAGFRLSNNLFITGSILLFPTYVYSWAVRSGLEITPESLIVFDLIVPKTKIVIIGYGQQGDKYNSAIPMILKKKGISCEMLPTPSAVTTYNFLVSDSVHVAGAFVPVRERIAATVKDTSAYENDYLLDGPYFGLSKTREDEAIEEQEAYEKYKKWNEKHEFENKKKHET